LQLDERERELNDLESQVRMHRQQLQQDHDALAQEQAKQHQLEADAAKQKLDKGFAEALKLYTAMSSKQAKQIFMTLDDATVIRYLSAMSPADAAKIVKEFKTKPEVDRIQLVLEKMRQGGPATQPITPAATATALQP